MSRWMWAATLVSAIALGGCASAYYGTMESFGYYKREILVDRVDEALESQEKAKEQFADALERFSAVAEFDGGDLEDLYDDLSGELEDSEQRADQVHKRIAKVKSVAEALFEEWEDELDDYSDRDLRRQSAQQLRDTRRRYARLIEAMEAAEDRIEPVLDTFRDQVLFLKHNLNARAIASLRTHLSDIETDVGALIEAMNRSIAEARAFIREMQPPG